MQHDSSLFGLLLKMKLFNSSLDTNHQNPKDLDSNMDADYVVSSDKEDALLHAGLDMTTVAPTKKGVGMFPSRVQRVLADLRYKCVLQHSKTPAPKTALKTGVHFAIVLFKGGLNISVQGVINNLVMDGPYCNRTIDTFAGCWSDAIPGEQVSVRCPELLSSNPTALAYRYCTINGTWFQKGGKDWGNYSQCFKANDDVSDTKYVYIFIGGFSLSLIMLVISLFIFFWFRQLRCDRITIHKNLFLSYVLTGTAWILYYVLVALNGDTQLHNPVWCQILHVLCQYFVVCNFLWMFCEGLYLNTIMVYAFTTGKTLIISCYIIGWGLPSILTIIYAVIRAHNDNVNYDCWLTDTSLLWIMYGPIVLSIAINVLFLINIVRLLITKLRQMPEADQTKKATRATLILVPLLGLQYLLFPIKPEEGSKLDEAYHVAVALLVSLQGAFISTMYCFCNGEVIQVLKRKWNQHRIMRSSTRASSTHGTTYTTMEPVTQTNTTYYSTACNKDPPLEMSKLEDEDR